MGDRPWLSPGTPPWATPAEKHRPPWWHGLGHRAALVALLIILDPARAARAWWAPIADFRKDADE